MNPQQALEYLLNIAKNAVLVAHVNGTATGLTYDDHARLSLAESTLGQALSKPTETAKGEPENGE